MSKSLVKPNPKKCVFVIRPALRQKRVFVQLIKCSISLVPPVCTKPHQSNVLLRNKCSHCSLDIVQWTSNNWHDLCNTIFCIKTMKDCSRSLKGSFISHTNLYLSALSFFKLTLLVNGADVWQMSVI